MTPYFLAFLAQSIGILILLLLKGKGGDGVKLRCVDHIEDPPMQVVQQEEPITVQEFTRDSIEYTFSIMRARKNGYCHCHALDIHDIAQGGEFYIDVSQDTCHAEHFAASHQKNLS